MKMQFFIIKKQFIGLKAVLIHKQKQFPAVPIAYSQEIDESYKSMERIFEKIQYNEHQWDVRSDLKVVALVTGMQTGNTKFSCCLCEFDTRSTEEHYIRRVWNPKPSKKNKEGNASQRISMISLFRIQTSSTRKRERPALDQKFSGTIIDST